MTSSWILFSTPTETFEHKYETVLNPLPHLILEIGLSVCELSGEDVGACT